MYKNFDIIIAGSGLAGLTSAIALSKIGYKIGLVDPRPFKDFLKKTYDFRTTALSYQAAEFYNKIESWKHIKKYTCPIRNILVEEPTSGAYSYLNKKNLSDSTLGFMIQNKNLFKVLLSIVEKNNNIIKIDDKIIHFNRKKDKIFIDLEKEKLCSSLLIAADGKNSFIRKTTNIKTFYKDYKQKAFIFNIKHQYSHKNLATENFLESGPLASLPLLINKSTKYSSIVWSCNMPYYYQFLKSKRKSLEMLIKRNLNKCYGDLEIISPISSWDLSLTNASKYVDHRILLIGDAAHAIHPIAGQGFNLTIRGINRFYETASTNYKDNQDLGCVNNLMSYNNAHYLDAKLLIMATDRLNFLFSNNNIVLRLLRRNGIKVFNRINLLKSVFKNYASHGKLSIT